MKLKTIQYSESYEYAEYGMKRWKKTGFEAELDDNEDPKEAHRTLRQLIDEIKAETIASIESQPEIKVTTIEKEEPLEPLEKIESWKQVISMCTSLTALDRFKKRVEEIGDDGLTAVFNGKKDQLSTNKQ